MPSSQRPAGEPAARSFDLTGFPPTMYKLCTFGGCTLGGYLGWFMAERFGFFTAFLVSGVGSILGIYLGWKLARKLEE